MSQLNPTIQQAFLMPYSRSCNTFSTRNHQVRLSIFPASTSTSCAHHGNNGHANDGSSSSSCSSNAGPVDDSKDCRPEGPSCGSKEPRLAGCNPRRPRSSGNTDDFVSDSSRQSAETDEAVVALRRARGYHLPEGLKGAGLLFVRYGRYGRY